MKVSWINSSQNSVSVPRNHSADRNGLLSEFCDCFFAEVITEFVLKIKVYTLICSTPGTLIFKIHLRTSWLASPWRGPARPLTPAEYERKGSARADPTKWVAWELTLYPSWSLTENYYEKSCSLLPMNWKIASDRFVYFEVIITKHMSEICSPIEVLVSVNVFSVLKTFINSTRKSSLLYLKSISVD